MAVIVTTLRCDLQSAVKVQYLDGNLFSQDVQANRIDVSVFDGGEEAAISGSVTADIVRADGQTVAATGGTIEGNVASIILPAAAYYIPGVVSIAVKMTTSGVVTTIACVVSNVYRSSTDTVVDPGTILPSIQSLITQIETAVASIPADYSSLWTKLAPAFDSSASYVAGQYVTYNGGLYRFIKTHSGAWSASEVVPVDVGGELSDLKSAFDDSLLDKYDMEFVGTYYDGNYSTATPPVFSGDGTVKKSAYWSTLVIPVPVGKKITLSGFPAQGGASSAWLNSSNPADVKEKAWASQYNNRTVDICKTAWLGISDYNYKGNTNNHAYVDKFEAVYETIDGIEHLRIVRNQCDVENATTGYYYTATGITSADNTYTIFPSIPVKKGEVFYSNRGSYIRSASSYFETVEGRTLLSTYDNVTALDANFIQLNGFVAPSDGNILITTQTSKKGEVMIVNGDVTPDTYSGYGTALGATVLDKKIVIGTVKPEDTSFYTMVSNLLNPDTLQSGKVYYETSTGTAATYSINYVRVKQGHVYSSNGYLNKNFSWFENHLGVRTILTSYEDYVVPGVGNDFIGLRGFVAPDDGYLRITTNPDSNTAVISVIEYAQQPTGYTAYGEPYKVFLNGQEALQTQKTLYVKKNGGGDFTSLSACIQYVNSHPQFQYTVYVGDGEYDLITELTAIDPDYFDGTHYGLALNNRAHYIFSSNSKVVCNYTGDNTNVKNLFSPFNCAGGGTHTGFTLENLTLEASNVRYCVHDETNGQEGQYKNEYLNCRFKIDNTNNQYGYPQCIGGGLGHNSEIIIKNCYFETADTTSALVELVTYHNANTSAASSYRSNVVIDACYFAGDNTSCRCSYCGNTAVKSRMMVSNCSMAKQPRVIEEVASSPYVNMELVKWNNEIRN